MRKQKPIATALYPSVFGNLRLPDVVRIARRLGLEVMTAYKLGMHCYMEIGVFGTKAAADRLRAICRENGNHLKPSSFKSVNGVNLSKPREFWVPIPLEHRDYCACWRFNGMPCDCDYDPGFMEADHA